MLHMQLTNTHKIIISALAVVVLLGIYIVFDRKSKNESDTSFIEDNQTATTTDTNNGLGYKIEQIKPGDEIPKPIPDLNRSVTQSPKANVSQADISSATLKIKQLQGLLKDNPASFAVWLDLAMYQKMAGDYDGAIISWKYASRVRETDYVALANIGNLYAYYLKDNAQAEIYYKQAISRDPTQSYLYAQLFEVYRDIFKDLDKARAILKQGLSKIPNDLNLLDLQYSLDPIKPQS